MKKTILTLAAVCLTGICMNAENLEGILRKVAADNPELKVIREEMRAAGYELEVGNTLEATSVEYSPFFRRGAGGVASSELIVTQEFDFPTLYASRGKAIRLGKEGLERSYNVRVAESMEEATALYLQLVYLTKKGENLAIRMETLRKAEEMMERRVSSGDATALDINRVRLQLMSVETEFASNETEKATVGNSLSLMSGFGETSVETEGYPSWSLSGVEVKRMAQSDAVVEGCRAEAALAAQEEKVARQSWLPRLTLGYRRNTEMDEALNGFVVGASFPLFSTGKKVKSAKARRVAAQMAVDFESARSETEMGNAIREAESAGKTLSTFDLGLLEDTRDLLMKSLDGKAITLTDFLTEMAVIDGQLSIYNDLEYEYYRKLSVVYKNQLMR